MSDLTFDTISIGKRFKLKANIVYKKISTTEAQVVVNPRDQEVKDGMITTAFYKTKLVVTIVK